jgi:hypothetical protein
MTEEAESRRALVSELDSSLLKELIAAKTSCSTTQHFAKINWDKLERFGQSSGSCAAAQAMAIFAQWDPIRIQLPESVATALHDDMGSFAPDAPAQVCAAGDTYVGGSTSRSPAPSRRILLSTLSTLYTCMKTCSDDGLRALRAVLPVQHPVRHVQEAIEYVNERLHDADWQMQATAGGGGAGASGGGDGT